MLNRSSEKSLHKVFTFKNLVLVHFFITSFGLIGVVKLFSIYVWQKFHSTDIALFDWARAFYFPEKREVLFRYSITITLLFFLYLLLYFLIYKLDNKKSKINIFNTVSYLLYLLFIFPVNILLFFANRFNVLTNNIFGVSYTFCIWLLFFSLPLLFLMKKQYLRQFLSSINESSRIRLFYFFGIMFFLLQLFLIFKPFVFERIKMINEYFDIPEKTLIQGKEVDNTSLINEMRLFGPHVKYDLEKDYGKDPGKSENCLVLADSEALENFVHNNKTRYSYSKSSEDLCVMAGMSSNERDVLSFLAESPELKEKINNIYLTQQKYQLEKKSVFSDDAKEFINKNKFEIHWQVLNRWVIQHNNFILSPINELTLGKDPKQVSMQYGWLSTVFIKNFLNYFGGFSIQNYFKVVYSFYYLYFLFFILALYLIFRRLDYIMAIFGISVMFLHQIGFDFLFLGPGINPIRHFFDVIVLIFFILYSIKGKNIYYYLYLGFSTVALLNGLFFGIFLWISVIFTSSVILYLKKTARSWIKFFALLTALVLGIYILFSSYFGVNQMLYYYSQGILSIPLPKGALFFTFLAITTGYLVYLKYFNESNNFKYLVLFLLVYIQGILVYYIWGSGDVRLFFLAPIIALLIFCLFKIILGSSNYLKHKENLILFITCLLIFLVSLPLIYSYYFSVKDDTRISKSTYDKIFKDHKTYEWKFDRAKFISTMDPKYFEQAAGLIKKYSSGNSIYIISKYDNILPIISSRYSAMPFFDTQWFLLGNGDMDKTVNAIQVGKPEYLFVDTDIGRNLNLDIIDADSYKIGYLNGESILRVERLSLLNDIYIVIRDEYKPIEKGYLITVYERL